MSLIELLIKIDNRIYKKRLKKNRKRNYVLYNEYQTNTYKKKIRTSEYYLFKYDISINLDVMKRKSLQLKNRNKE